MRGNVRDSGSAVSIRLSGDTASGLARTNNTAASTTRATSSRMRSAIFSFLREAAPICFIFHTPEMICGIFRLPIELITDSYCLSVPQRRGKCKRVADVFGGKFLVNNNKYPCAPLCKRENCREFRRETYKISTMLRNLSLSRRGSWGWFAAGRGGAASAGGVVCLLTASAQGATMRKVRKVIPIQPKGASIWDETTGTL